ncbi:MAG: hypothetical protein AAFR66_23935, partial [Bacteroidota bacterium]
KPLSLKLRGALIQFKEMYADTEQEYFVTLIDKIITQKGNIYNSYFPAEKKKKELSDFSVEELEGKKKTLRTLIGMMIGMCIVAIVFVLYSVISGTGGDNKLPALMSMGMLGFVALISNNQITAINTELANRNSN